MGKMVDIKYNYDDPVNTQNASNDLYAFLIQFGIIIAFIILSNIVLSILSIRKYKTIIGHVSN